MTKDEITAMYIRVLDRMVEKGLVKRYTRTPKGDGAYDLGVAWTQKGFGAASALKQIALTYALGYQGGDALAFTNAAPGDRYLVDATQIPIEPALQAFWNAWAKRLGILHDVEALGVMGQIVGECGPDPDRSSTN
jgi:hypothetical protein